MRPAGQRRLLWLILFCEISLFLALYSADLSKWPNTYKKISAAPSSKHFFTTIKDCSFKTENSLKGWEEKVFKDKSEYRIVQESGELFLRSKSQNAASGLFKKVDLKLTPGLTLSWRWRVTEFPVKARPAELSDRSQDDFAARVYVVFPGSSFFNTHVIEYLWDQGIKPGTFRSSPYSGKVKLFVIQSGKQAAPKSGWISEERNLYNDYFRLFGQKPDKPIGAIALMTDSDNTHTSSGADIADFIFKRQS